MAILLPKLDILIPLVGVTSGTLCAFVFPPALETIVFWRIWRRQGRLWYVHSSLIQSLTSRRHCRRNVVANVAVACVGFALIGAGVYTNCVLIYNAFANLPELHS